MVEHWNSDSGREEQLWWKSGTEMVEQWNNDGETVEQIWWNSGTEMVDQWNKDGGTVKKRDKETVELICNSDGGT